MSRGRSDDWFNAGVKRMIEAKSGSIAGSAYRCNRWLITKWCVCNLGRLLPACGLYAALMGCVVVYLFGSSRLMMIDPMNASPLTTVTPVTPSAAMGSRRLVMLALMLTCTVGLLRFLFRVARIQNLVDKTPFSAIVYSIMGVDVMMANI